MTWRLIKLQLKLPLLSVTGQKRECKLWKTAQPVKIRISVTASVDCDFWHDNNSELIVIVSKGRTKLKLYEVL